MSINKTEKNIEQNVNELSRKGYDINLVINKNYLNSLDDIYKCSLCQKIMLNPSECELCGHNYCYNCLNASGCIFGCKPLKINKASLSIYNILNNIKFGCSNIGCTETLLYPDVEKHIDKCLYQKIKCKNEGCNKIILKKDIMNHNKNECEYIRVKCKFCNNEFIKKEIKSHEQKCELCKKDKEKIDYDNDKIDLKEYLRGLSNNLNEIIKDNKKLAEIFNSKNQNENLSPYRFSIRKSIVPGFEGDEFFDIIKEELNSKIKKYYTNFNNNYEKILKEIEDLKPLLNQYIKEEKQIQIKKEKEGIKIYLNDLITKIEKEINNIKNKSEEQISSEVLKINNFFENKSDNINKNQKNKNDMYSSINILFNNLGKYLFESNDKINLLTNNFFTSMNNLLITCNKSKDFNKEIIQIENTQNNNKKLENKDNINSIENKKIFLNNVNNDLTELKNKITNAVDLINEKFADYYELINQNKLKSPYKFKYEICNSISFYLNHLKIPSIGDQIKISKDNNKLISLDDLNNLETRLTNLETQSKEVSLRLKEKLNSEISNKLNEININIEKDMDKKINTMFTLKQCKECERFDYLYGFIKCKICSEERCKQCVILCTICKQINCLKCGICKKCGKNICKSCRNQCISCNEYYCQMCISNCPNCKSIICTDCISEKCSVCNENIFCVKCGKKCPCCEKQFCVKCIKNIEFSQCYLCKNSPCVNCFKECKEHNKNICLKCCDECSECKNSFCINNIISCNKCKKKFCVKCSENFIKNNNCKLCKNIFCKDCFTININNKIKCFFCNKKPCLNCSIKCISCSNTSCKECSNLCKNCNEICCIKCSSDCLCEKIFCSKCISKNEIIFPHECIYFLNNCAITDAKKSRSLKKIPNNLNIEAKFSVLMDDISDQSFLLVGIIDKENINEENNNIFAVNVNNGDKFSTKKGFESFFDFDEIKKGINYVYVMIKANKLFFKVNESIYKWAYDLNKVSDYWFYVENNIKGSATKFFYIKRIK